MYNMEDLFKCPVCEVACVSKNNVLSHVDKHEGFPLSCIICRSSFKNNFSFDYHLISELCKKAKKHVGQLRQCPQCPQTFPNRRHLNKHVEGHRRNNCQYCEARFTTRKELTLHMAHDHKMKLQKAKFQCQFCERCFVKQVTLFNHYNHHANGKFVCQGCGLFLDTMEEFETHRERHEQERPWKCTRCATTFSRRQQYVVHMEVCLGKLKVGDWYLSFTSQIPPLVLCYQVPHEHNYIDIISKGLAPVFYLPNPSFGSLSPHPT